MLARMTAGYHDFEQDPLLTKMLYRNPFGAITTQDQLRLALDEPLQFTRVRTGATRTAIT